LPLVGVDLALWLSDTTFPNPLTFLASTFYEKLRFPALLPVIAHTGHHYMYMNLLLDSTFNYTSRLFVYASGYKDAHGPTWTTSLVQHSALFERRDAIDRGLPLPISVS
jgi:hypothetical protein